MKSSRLLVAFAISVLELSVLSSQISPPIITEKSGHRIVGGYPISINKVPWIVQIAYNGRAFCGGSILSTTKILSAAHCTIEFARKKIVIRADTSKSNFRGQIRHVPKMIEHPQYSHSRSANDIAILFLKKPLTLSSSVAVINIDAPTSVLDAGIEVLATGWGRICETCNTFKTLQAVKLPVIANDRCSKMYKRYESAFKILPSMLCCGLEMGGKDSCAGDSGGPITFNNTLVGIVSFGVGCARPNLPGVYTRVSYFASWIKGYL